LASVQIAEQNFHVSTFSSTSEAVTNSYVLQSSVPVIWKWGQTNVITIQGVVPYNFRAIKLSHVASYNRTLHIWQRSKVGGVCR